MDNANGSGGDDEWGDVMTTLLAPYMIGSICWFVPVFLRAFRARLPKIGR